MVSCHVGENALLQCFARLRGNLGNLLIVNNILVSNYALLIPNKGAKSRLRVIKRKKVQIIPLNLDSDLLFRISEALLEN